MQKEITLRLLPNEAANNQIITTYLAQTCGVETQAVQGFYITKQSIDARSRKQVWINLTIKVFINEPYLQRTKATFYFKNVRNAKKKVVVIGAGPAGLLAALQLVELGIKPIIIERGKPVKERRRDLALLNKQGIINIDSNYCFGEGGAGTYSDGKLYTRSNKRGSINRILDLFVEFGSEEKILYQSHPHIGTNKLPHIIEAMRNALINFGAEFYFEHRVTDFKIENNNIVEVFTNKGLSLQADAYILATGHSARDIFELLNNKNILIEAKPFALGVRIEHPQEIIDSIQYHCAIRDENLPPSSYSLVEQVDGRGVFSFCMCPGGIIATASTSEKELVVNGWSPSKRNNSYANSGMVVTVNEQDALQYFSSKQQKNNALLMMQFQQAIEQIAYEKGGGNFVAPAQRMIDFCENKLSSSLPKSSYHRGLQSVELNEVLPNFIYQSLQKGLYQFGKKMKGYYTNEAVVVATESRTSSPVKIPREQDSLQHVQIKNLYPCGEGAGYAGGIVSAAMDGENVAKTDCNNHLIIEDIFMTKKQRYQAVIDYFSVHNPDAETELMYDNPYQLLVAVILSAQCTDVRVNMTTPAIFKKYPTPEKLAAATFDELFPFIKSISYPNNKTKHLIGMANMLVEKFNSKVPMTVDELILLPGVGRKTANVITSVIDQQPNMAVDTHVFRVSARIGLTTNATTPLATEKQLIENIPEHLVHKAHHWLILHGRYVCLARKPKCEECGLQHCCKYFKENAL